MVTIRDVINAILWRGICSECYLLIEDRFAGMGFVEIPACSVKRVDAHYIYFKDGKILPIHRVRRVMCGEEIMLDR